MKQKLIVLGAAALLAGCVATPQTSDELRAAAKSSMFGEVKSQKVSRNYSAVVASLRAGSQKCLNRNVQSKSTTYNGRYGPTTQVLNSYYTSSIKSRGNATEMALHRRNGNGGKVLGIGPEQQGLMYVVDARPVSGGTQLDFYGGKFNYGAIDAAVMQWAKGGSIRCPDLP